MPARQLRLCTWRRRAWYRSDSSSTGCGKGRWKGWWNGLERFRTANGHDADDAGNGKGWWLWHDEDDWRLVMMLFLFKVSYSACAHVQIPNNLSVVAVAHSCCAVT